MICHTIVADCDTPITSMTNLERMAVVMKVVAAMEMRWEMAAARVGRWLLVLRFMNNDLPVEILPWPPL
jgi:hypothetical protein